MTFVTHLTLQSGDRDALDGTVEELRSAAERKGAAFKGPHSNPPKSLHVPQHRCLDGNDDRRFPSWKYTVFSREIEIHGHETFARSIASRSIPQSVHVEVEVEQIRGLGQK